LLVTFCSFAQVEKSITFKGIVSDIETNEPLLYASIYLTEYGYGTSTNDKGEFILTIKNFASNKNKLSVSIVGYQTALFFLSSSNKEIDIKLTPQIQKLEEVVVTKQKYRNKNNPAVNLIRKVIENKASNRTEALEYYENEKYEKVQFAKNDITIEFQKKKVFKHFQFMFENIDSLKNKGRKILPMYLKEDISNYYYQRTPRKVKEVVTAHKAVTFPGFDNKGIQDNIKYLYQDIDIYDNNILFLSNHFLSPIADLATTFYMYDIVDTIRIENSNYIKLFFGPRNKQDILFQGYLYISLDGSYAVKKVELSLNKDINLNWINDVKLIQEFDKAKNNSLMLSSEQISINFGLSKKNSGLFGQKIVRHSNYKFAPVPDENIFKGLSLQMNDSANVRSNEYWEIHRPERLSRSEAGTYTAMDSLLNLPEIKRAIDIAGIVLFGYRDFGEFEIGPINTFYMYNPIEGVRLRFGGRTTDKLSKKLNLESYIAYGFTDKLPKYYLGASWSFTKRNFMEFPVKSLKMSFQNETQLPGQQMQFLMEDNILLSIKRGVNDKLFYNKTYKIEHLNEFQNHFSYTIGYKFTNQTPGGNLYFNYTDYLSHQNDVNNINISEFYLNLRFAPHESFYQGKTYRIPIYSKYPIFELKYAAGNKIWNNDYNYQSLRFSMRKRVYISVLGYSDVVWEAGKIFGKVPYPLLNLPQANQTYSYQIESYNMMNFLEFVTDQYTSLMIDHNFNGFFFNKIPLMRHLSLREIVTFKALYGNVTSLNNPAQQNDLFRLPIDTDGTPISYTLGKTPYIEGSIGVGNIFKFFRVDLVKRFTYLNNPNVPEWGLRMRFRFDF
jgi:hypothetical protein